MKLFNTFHTVLQKQKHVRISIKLIYTKNVKKFNLNTSLFFSLLVSLNTDLADI